jgi:PAS domain S-box-containing protein
MKPFATKSKLRKEVEERRAELAETWEFVNQIIDTIPDVLYIIDMNDKRMVYISKAVRSYGYTQYQIYELGNNLFEELIHPNDLERVLSVISEMISFRNNEIRENQFRIKASDGEYRYVSSRTMLFNNGQDGKPLQILGIIQDVTAKIIAEKAYEEEKGKCVELTRANELLDLFVHAAAHDLKGPSGNLLLLSEMIKDADSDQKKLELAGKIEPMIRGLNRTVSSILDIIKIEKSSDKVIKHLDFCNIWNSVRKELADEIEKANAIINLNFDSCTGMDYVESFLISIFRNIVSNALKYRSMERRLTIDISAECSGNTAVLRFTDNGIGMDIKCFKTLFQPFTRFNTKTEGSGIGLYIVNTMVTRNGGKVEVESRRGSGTTFRVFLVDYSQSTAGQ